MQILSTLRKMLDVPPSYMHSYETFPFVNIAFMHKQKQGDDFSTQSPHAVPSSLPKAIFLIL